MRCAFICRRPLQLMTILNIILNGVEEVDRKDNVLFMLDYPNVDKNINFQVLSEYFKKIYIIFEKNPPKTSMTDFNYLSYKWKPFVFLQDMYSSIDVADFKGYNKIFGTYLNSFLVGLANVNVEAEVIFFDNGLGCYIYGDESKNWKLEAKFRHKIIQLIFGTGLLSVNPKCLYVYDPRLVVESTSYEIRKLPGLDVCLVELLKSVFYNSKCIKKCVGRKIYFLAQPIKFLETSNFSESSIIKLITKNCPDYVYRKHPVQQNVTNTHLDTSNSMWELLINDLDEGSLLVSYTSTALFTPYILYRRKNPIVFLYKIIFDKEKKLDKRMDEFTKKFMNLFHGKIYIPNNFEEFENILTRWREDQ